MAIETLTPGGPRHWGVMLAQGWKGRARDDRLAGELACSPRVG